LGKNIFRRFTDAEKKKIIGSLTKALDETGFKEKKVWGKL